MREVVSEAYAAQLKELHEKSASFGVGNVTSKHYKTIRTVVEKKGFASVLDYGCGKGHFIEYAKDKMPNLKVAGYDVASAEYGVLPPESFDLTICLDVMEHVEFGALANVLSEIRDHTNHCFICSVANYPASKVLPDGRNAHVTQMPFGYWFNLFSMYFRVDQFIRTGKAEGLFIGTTLKTQSDWR
jgi:2-polyprenyl-3-methyl-5-hydroxy-6-metoxy-1,4-benzoquinol methylase